MSLTPRDAYDPKTSKIVRKPQTQWAAYIAAIEGVTETTSVPERTRLFTRASVINAAPWLISMILQDIVVRLLNLKYRVLCGLSVQLLKIYSKCFDIIEADAEYMKYP